MRRILGIACIALAFALSLVPQTQQQLQQALSPEGMKQFQDERTRLYQWDSMQFMLGTWRTQGANAAPGFEVTKSLGGKVLIISNSDPGVVATSAVSRTSTTYKSLTYVYVEGVTPRATMYDNQGHIVTYDVQSGPQKVTLVSSTATAPQINFEETKDGVVSIAVQRKGAAAAKGAPAAPIQAIRISK